MVGGAGGGVGAGVGGGVGGAVGTTVVGATVIAVVTVGVGASVVAVPVAMLSGTDPASAPVSSTDAWTDGSVSSSPLQATSEAQTTADAASAITLRRSTIGARPYRSPLASGRSPPAESSMRGADILIDPMPSSSSTKRAARLAQKGKGKRVRFQGGTLFPMLILLILVVGIGTIVYARASVPAADASPPTIEDHWHMAYGFSLCDQPTDSR